MIAVALAVAPLAHASAPAGDVPAVGPAAGPAVGVEYRIAIEMPKASGSLSLDAATPVRFRAPDGTTGTIDLRSLAENWVAAGLASKVEGTIAAGRAHGTVTVAAPRVRDGKVRIGIRLGQVSRAAAKAVVTGTMTVTSTATYPACPSWVNNEALPFSGTCQGMNYAAAAVNGPVGAPVSTKASFCLISGTASHAYYEVGAGVMTPSYGELKACGTASINVTYSDLLQMRSCDGGGSNCSAASTFRATVAAS